ncbi:MAG: hypothetical protein WBP16_03395, partial [Ferruginibacter sp.]
MQFSSFIYKRTVILYFFLILNMVLYSQSPVTKGAVVTSTKPADAVNGDVYAIITGVSNYPGISPLKFA